MLQDDRVSPEGDKVMSRGDPEVGQLLGVCYIIHIHKQHPVVAELAPRRLFILLIGPRSLFKC